MNYCKINWTQEGQRVDSFVYEDDCSGFPLGGKGVRRPRIFKDRQKMLLSKRRKMWKKRISN